MKLIRSFSLALGLCLFDARAEAAFPQLKLETVCENQLVSPVAMVHAGDGSGRMFVADQRGAIRIFRNGMLEPENFLNLAPKLVAERATYDERGLLGLAFHPGYGNPASPGYRRFYVFYIATSPNAPGVTTAPVDSREVIAEYQASSANPDVADPASERILMTWDKPQFNHGGGGLAFGPDGFLYLSVGDGGSSDDNNYGHTGGAVPRPTNAKGNSQDLTKLLGKLHRIDPLGTNGPGGQYGIPATNPFATSPGGERPEIYAYGLRNTWRFSFDSRPGGTNRLFAADVGQGSVEEIDIITNGGNYGWRNKEGTFSPAFSADAPAMTGAAIDPIAQYAHPGIVLGSPALPQYGVSCTGGYVYRGSAIPGLVGKYVFGDYSQAAVTPNGPLLGVEETSPGVWALAFLDVLGGNPIGRFIQGFGVDESGELYVLTKQARPASGLDLTTGLPSGRILKIVPVPATTPLNLTASKDNTIYQESSNSNGAGSWLFAGATEVNNNGAFRRALLAFNLTPIPVGATVASAAITLTMDKTIAPAYSLSLHKLLTDWGEGTANANAAEGTGVAPSANDVTWLKPFFGQAPLWINAGGDFSTTPSASTTVVNGSTIAPQNYTWAGPRLTTDINGWLAASATNFGWMLKVDMESSVKTATGNAEAFTIIVSPDTDGLLDGMPVKGFGITTGAAIAPGGINTLTNEVTLTLANLDFVSGNIYFAVPSAKRFVSRQGAPTGSRPKLAITYVPPPAPLSHRKAWESQNYYIGEYINDSSDTDKDSLTDGIEYAWGFSPKTRNPMSDGLTVNYDGVPGGSPLIVTFRRDPLATDLTYELQASSDLATWTTICQSVGGAIPTGTAYVGESVISGQSPYRNVVVSDTAATGSKRFVRLKVTR